MSAGGAKGDASAPTRTRRRLIQGVSTNVMVLGLVSFLTDLSSEMIYPVLPLFLTALGAGGLMIGLIEGAAETTASLLKVFSGWFSDRRDKRKPFLIGGYGSSALVKPLLVVASSPWHVLGIRLTERVGKGIRSAPRDALVADSTARESMGKAFGFHKAMDSAGAVAGVIAALVLLALVASMEEMERFRLVFLVATVPAFAGVLVILLFVREKERGKRTAAGAFRKDMAKLSREFWFLMAVVVIFYIGEINYAFFILKGQDAGFSDTAVIALYLLYNIVFVLVAIPSGSLSDRLGRRPVIVFSFSVFVLTCVTMAAADGVILLVAGFALFGLYKGTSEGVLKAYVVDVIPRDLRGTALGAFHTSVGLVMLPGGLIAGLLWDSVGPWATFAYGGIMATAAAIMLAAFGRSGRPAA